AETRNATLAPLLVGMHDDFRVALAAEDVSQCEQFATERSEVIDFAVEGEEDVARFVRQWLLPAGQIDNRQAAVPEGHSVAPQQPLTVGPAVPLERRQVSDPCLGRRRAGEIDDPCYSAHD